jgi:hypothetical protein
LLGAVSHQSGFVGLDVDAPDVLDPFDSLDFDSLDFDSLDFDSLDFDSLDFDSPDFDSPDFDSPFDALASPFELEPESPLEDSRPLSPFGSPPPPPPLFASPLVRCAFLP